MLSNFDYLVLASIADSPHLAAMASYRLMGTKRSAPSPLDRSTDKHDRYYTTRDTQCH
jgi:hypothetical protein